MSSFSASRRFGHQASKANTHYRFTGQLYQLFSASELAPGAYVGINGVHDTFGVIRRSQRCADGTFLNLVRGCRPQVGSTPVASF